MSDDEQTEQTPKGMTVPVPKRDEFFGNLKKVSKPEKVDAPTEPDQPHETAAS